MLVHSNLFEQIRILLSGVEGIKTQFLVIMILFSLLQFGMVLMVMVTTFWVRFRQSQQAGYQSKRREIWYGQLFEYLEDNSSDQALLAHIKPKDRWIFLEFLKDFLVDLDGKDKDTLVLLIRKLNLTPLLYRQLRHRNQYTRAFAVFYLGMIQEQSAIPRLIERLEDESPSVALLAASQLMKLQYTEGIELILEQLGRLGEDYRSRVDFIFLEYGTEVLPHLQRAFENVYLEPWIRLVLIDVFKYFRYFPITPRLIFLFHCTLDPETKINCIKCLAQFNDPELQPFFIEAVQDANPAVQSFAIKALGSIGGEAEVELIASFVGTHQFWVAQNAVLALLELGEAGVHKLRQLAATDLPEINRNIVLENLPPLAENHGL